MDFCMLPGLDGTGDLFAPFTDVLGPSHRAHVARYPVDVASYAPLLDRVVAALPTERPFALIAESFSGPLALMAASRRPPGLRAVVLCATFVENPVRFPSAWMSALVRPGLLAWAPEAVVARVLLGSRPPADLRARLSQTLRSVPPETLAGRVRAILGVSVWRELEVCAYPTLYLRASRDRVVARRNAERIRGFNPHVAVAEIDAPHLILQAAPRRSLEAIRRFLSEAASGAVL